MNYGEMLEREYLQNMQFEIELYEAELKHFEEMIESSDFPQNMIFKVVE